LGAGGADGVTITGGGGAGLATGGAGFSGSVAQPARATVNAASNAVVVFTWFLPLFSSATWGRFKHERSALYKRFFERKPMLA
jgi:hypothetical protein